MVATARGALPAFPKADVRSAARPPHPLSVLQALRADAWLHAHGDPTGEAAPAIRAQVRAAFADDDPAWLAKITERFAEVSDAALAALAS